MSYAQPFQFEIQPGLPLMIMACSETKRPAIGRVRFTDLYAGPMWLQLRAAGYPVSNIAAISALYGFLEPGSQIETYDVKIDEKRSARICGLGDSVARLRDAVKIAGSAIVFGGGLYREVAATAERWDPSLAGSIVYASGSFLQQRKQLGEWLRNNSTQLLAA